MTGIDLAAILKPEQVVGVEPHPVRLLARGVVLVGMAERALALQVVRGRCRLGERGYHRWAPHRGAGARRLEQAGRPLSRMGSRPPRREWRPELFISAGSLTRIGQAKDPRNQLHNERYIPAPSTLVQRCEQTCFSLANGLSEAWLAYITARCGGHKGLCRFFRESQHIWT